MGVFIWSKLIKSMTKTSIDVINSKVLIMGITYKENCPDIRNSKINIVNYLKNKVSIIDFLTHMPLKRGSR